MSDKFNKKSNVFSVTTIRQTYKHMEPSGNQKALLADLEADKIAIGQHVVYVNGRLEFVSNNREEALIYSLSIKDRKNNKVYYQLVRDPTLPDIVYKV